MSAFSLLLLVALMAVTLAPAMAGTSPVGGGGTPPPVPVVPSVAWQSGSIDSPRRGVACTSARYYNPTSQHYDLDSQPIYYTGGRNSSQWTSDQFLQSTGALLSFAPYEFPDGSWSVREGHFLHWSDNGPGNIPAFVLGAGKNGDSSSTGLETVIMSYSSGDWTDGDYNTEYPPAPMGNSWNWTTTPWLEPLAPTGGAAAPPSARYLLALYGGWVPDNSPATGHIDNNFYLAEADHTLQAANAVTQAVASPFAFGRNGPAMGGFNASSGDPGAGLLVVMGGWDITTGTIWNDVWVASTARPGGQWRNCSSLAPWSPRWGQKVFDSGRLGLIVYGGYVQPGLWQRNDVWYGQWSSTNTYSTDPVWTKMSATSAPGLYEPACSVAYWLNSYTLYLVTMSSKTDDAYNLVDGSTPPTEELNFGLVTWGTS